MKKMILVVLTAMVLAVTMVFAGGASASNGSDAHKWYVCKYVGKPGVDERLQTGQNPIFVDEHAIAESPVVKGSYFKDGQYRSFVLDGPYKHKLNPEPSVSQCPPGDAPQPSESPSPTQTPKPSESPKPTETVPTPTETVTVPAPTQTITPPVGLPAPKPTPHKHKHTVKVPTIIESGK